VASDSGRKLLNYGGKRKLEGLRTEINLQCINLEHDQNTGSIIYVYGNELLIMATAAINYGKIIRC